VVDVQAMMVDPNGARTARLYEGLFLSISELNFINITITVSKNK